MVSFEANNGSQWVEIDSYTAGKQTPLTVYNTDSWNNFNTLFNMFLLFWHELPVYSTVGGFHYHLIVLIMETILKLNNGLSIRHSSSTYCSFFMNAKKYYFQESIVTLDLCVCQNIRNKADLE